MIKKISIISVLIVVLSFFVYCAFGAGEADEVLAEEADVIKVIKVTESNRDEVFATKLSSGTAETYDPSTRKWNGIPHIERTAKGRLWVTWFSGGPNEPDDDNYVILAYSDDNGETWNDPFIIIDVADTSLRAFDPFLFTRKNGELIVYFYSNGGRWEMTVKNPDATPADIVCGKPKLTEQNLKACIQEPVRLKNGEVMALSQPGINSKQLDAMVSLDDGLSWKLRSTMYSVSANKGISEAKVVELNDGTLWAMARIDGGKGVERFVSADGGYNWSEPEYDLGYPLIGPGSRFNITKLKSGNIIFVTNDSTSSRTAMTVFLSVDDGKTWPYSLLIDDRSNVTYPEVCEDDEGYIYLVYDKGRDTEKEVRLCIFNEADIVAGAIKSEKGKDRLCVVKDAELYDIISVKDDYGRYKQVAIGTSKQDIISSLPSTVTAIAENGETFTLTGDWKTYVFQSKKKGVYKFTFAYNEILPKGVQDGRGMLSIRVRVGDTDEVISSPDEGSSSGKGGCRGRISYANVNLFALVLVLSVLSVSAKAIKSGKFERS